MVLDACRTLRFTKPMNGNALIGHIIRNLTVEAESLCKLSCYLEAICVSFNTGPLQDGKHACELSDSDHHIHPEDLIRREGYVYWPTKQVTSSKPCGRHYSVIPLYVCPFIHLFRLFFIYKSYHINQFRLSTHTDSTRD